MALLFKKNFLLSLLLSGIYNSAPYNAIFAASPKTIDSLQLALQKSPSDTGKVKILYAMWKQYVYDDNEKAMLYAQEQYRLSKNLNYKPGICKALYCLGFCFSNEGNYPKALSYTLASLKESEDINDNKIMLTSYQQIAFIYFSQERFIEALPYLEKALKIAELLHDENCLAGTLCSIGTIYLNKKEYGKSLIYFKKSLAKYRKLEQTADIALATANIGEAYKKMDSLETALKYYSEAERISTKSENIEDKDNLVFVYTAMGEVSGRMGNHRQSGSYFNKALSLSEEISDSKRAKREIFEKMADEYERTGDYKNANKYRRIFVQLKDSLLNEKTAKEMTRLQAQYENEKKDKKIKLLKKEKALQQARENRLTIIIWSSVTVGILLLAITVLLYRAYIQKQKKGIELALKVKQRTAELKEVNDNLTLKINELCEKDQKLTQSNKDLNILFYRLTHDLRSPLVSVMGLVNVFKSTTDAETVKTTLEYIDQSVTKMDALLIDLNSINKVRQVQPVIIPVEAATVVEEIFNIYRIRPELADVKLEQDIESGLIIYTDNGIFHSLVQNLVDNAIKYRKLGFSGSIVSVKARSHKNGVLLQVIDNGRGMKPEISAKAFDLMFRGSDSTPGSGLGLYIVKSSIEKLGGTIKLDSVYGQGTTFELFLPDGKRAIGNSMK